MFQTEIDVALLVSIILLPTSKHTSENCRIVNEMSYSSNFRIINRLHNHISSRSAQPHQSCKTPPPSSSRRGVEKKRR